MDGYGYPPLDSGDQKKILGENFARMHGLDLQSLYKKIPKRQVSH